MSNEIGNRLRQLRIQNKLSQRKLARQSGVANATISLIEHNKLNPTVSMLKKVLNGIPISMSEFFSDESNTTEKVFFRANELIEIADGDVSYLQVGANLKNRSLQLLKECYKPGAGTGKHQMTHDGEECGLILSGRLEVTVSGQTQTLSAGDAYYFNSQLPHSFHNSSNEPCELISACSPPTF